MARKTRQNIRRIDTRPRNRPDVQAGVTGAHLGMRGELIGGRTAGGQAFGTKQQSNQMGGKIGLTPGQGGLDGFYAQNPHVKPGEFDPTGKKSLTRKKTLQEEAITPFTDPNRPGGKGGGDPLNGGKGQVNVAKGAPEGPSRQGARVREAQARNQPQIPGVIPPPKTKAQTNVEETAVVTEQMANLQAKSAELDAAMQEQKNRQSAPSPRERRRLFSVGGSHLSLTDKQLKSGNARRTRSAARRLMQF